MYEIVSATISCENACAFTKMCYNNVRKTSVTHKEIMSEDEFVSGCISFRHATVYLKDMPAKDAVKYITVKVECDNANDVIRTVAVRIQSITGTEIEDYSPENIVGNGNSKHMTVSSNHNGDLKINDSTETVYAKAYTNISGKLIVDGGCFVVSEGTKVTCDEVVVYSGSLLVHGELVVKNGITVKGGELSLGSSLWGTPVNGALITAENINAKNGTVRIESGLLKVDDIKLSTAYLGTILDVTGGVIKQNGGRILVKYDFLAKSNRTSELTGGELWVGGDFKHGNKNDNFIASGTHSAIFYGSKTHSIDFDKGAEGKSYFNNLYIDNNYKSNRGEKLSGYIKGAFRRSSTNAQNYSFTKNGVYFDSVYEWERNVSELANSSFAIELGGGKLSEVFTPQELNELGNAVGWWAGIISSPLIKTEFDKTSEINASVTMKVPGKAYSITFITKGLSYGQWGSLSFVSWYCDKLGVPEENAVLCGGFAGADTKRFQNQAAVYLAKGVADKVIGSYRKNVFKLASDSLKDIGADEIVDLLGNFNVNYKVYKTVSKYNNLSKDSKVTTNSVGLKTSFATTNTFVYENIISPPDQIVMSASQPVESVVLTQALAEGNELLFTDNPELESAIKKALSLDESVILTDAFASQIKYLDISDSKLISLEGIEQFSNLEVLILDDNYVADLTPLTSINGLVSLSASNNNIRSVSDISGLSQLCFLDLSHNMLTDIMFVKKLVSLKSLDVSFNYIESLEGLGSVTDIEILDLSGNIITSGNVNELSGLLNLKAVYVSGCELNDLSGIKSPVLEILVASNNNLSSLSVQVESLETVILNNNNISDICFLKDAVKMRSLDLNNNLISDDGTDAVFSLISLEELDVSNNNITDLQFLTGASSLKNLNINENTVASLDAIEKLTLKNFYASGCGIDDEMTVSIGKITTVENLDVSNNNISDLTFLANLNSLEQVDVSSNMLELNAANGEIVESLENSGVAVACLEESVKVNDFKIYTSSVTLLVGDEYTVKHLIFPVNSTNKKVEWRSSNESVATVDCYGNITALGKGNVKIYGVTEDGGYTAECTVKIVPKQYTVTWIIDGTETTEVYEYGAKISVPVKPEKEGCFFAGWTNVIPSSMPARNLTFIAKFVDYDVNRISVIINRPESIMVQYRDSIVFSASAANLPKGAKFKWKADSEKVLLEPSADGKTCKVTSVSNGNVIITVYIVDANGNVVTNENGVIINDTEGVVSEVTFWSIIVYVFKRLFTGSPFFRMLFNDLLN